MAKSLNLNKVYEDFKNKIISKLSFLGIIQSIIEEHENESVRLQAIELLNDLKFRDKSLFTFFEHLLISDINEKIRNAAMLYISNNFLEKSLSLFKWVINHENSYKCQVTLIQSFQKLNHPELREILINILKKITKVRFLSQEKQYENRKHRKVLKLLLKSEKLSNIDHTLLSDIILNFFTIRHLIKLFPNVFFELNHENALIEQLDLSDYLEYEVKGTPWGWKNNIDRLSKIEGLWNLKALKVLDLSNNLLNDIKEIVALKNLTHLNLTNNRIDDLKTCTYFNELHNLKYLNLEGNPLSHKINLNDFNKDLELILSNKDEELELILSNKFNKKIIN